MYLVGNILGLGYKKLTWILYNSDSEVRLLLLEGTWKDCRVTQLLAKKRGNYYLIKKYSSIY